MSKYIIDLRPDCKVVQQICVSDDNVGVGARSVELFDALTDDYVKENFKDLLEGEYQRGLEEGKKATFGLVADASNAEYQKGFEDGKAVNDKGCEGCRFTVMGSDTTICAQCCNAYHNRWTAKDTYYDIICNSIHNWVTELNVKLEDISKVLEDMKHD